MEYNKHINIRITDEQLKILMSAVIDEKTNLSTLVRNIINGYSEKKNNSFNKRKPKSEK